MSNLVATQAANLAKSLSMGDNTAELLGVLKATAFKGQVTDAQMTALLVVANQYGLNPWTKEIYAFPDRNNGIVPVVGVDGWSRIINSHPQFDGMDFEQDDQSCTCIIYRKDRSHPVRVTEYMAECRREGVAPWKSHPRRMLRHKAMIQCARLAFGFVGIYEQDEAERIVEATYTDVTPQRGAKAAAAAIEQIKPAESQERDAAMAAANLRADEGYSSLEAWWKDPENKAMRLLIQDALETLKERARKADSLRDAEVA
jgi:phage recombination protein Bet